MPTTSQLPDVLDALTAVCTADDVLIENGVEVVDGPVPSEMSVFHRLYIGSSEFPDEPGATTEDAAGDELPEFLYAETLSITCTAEEWMGSVDAQDVPQLRRRAYSTVDRVRVLCAGPAPLGMNALSSARITSTRYEPRQTGETVSVTVVFTIQFQASVTTSTP